MISVSNERDRLRSGESRPEEKRHANCEKPPRVGLRGTRCVADGVRDGPRKTAARDRIKAQAANAKDKESRDKFRLVAKSTMLLGAAAAKRLQNSAENTADSYVRAMRNAAEEAAAAAKKPVKKAAKAKEE